MIVEWTLTPLAEAHKRRRGLTDFDIVGYLGTALSDSNPKGAVEQLHDSYRHGGGWHKFEGFRYDPETNTLRYPGDPPTRAVAEAKLRDERIVLFESAWVAVIQPDGSFEVARMD